MFGSKISRFVLAAVVLAAGVGWMAELGRGARQGRRAVHRLHARSRAARLPRGRALLGRAGQPRHQG
ncbi:hypothetical protein ACFSTC_11450 [Nonomuraea ferruginea]